MVSWHATGRELKHESYKERLLHVDRAHSKWEEEFATTLSQLGIRMDVTASTPRESKTRNARGAAASAEPYSWRALRALAEVHGFTIEDRTGRGGRLWVSGPLEDGFVGSKLTDWGFRWAAHRNAWYREESEK